jgi:hypothetical protein
MQNCKTLRNQDFFAAFALLRKVNFCAKKDGIEVNVFIDQTEQFVRGVV